MNKTMAARWVSVVVVGALAIGCGNRSNREMGGAQALSPAACVPPPAATLAPPPASAAAAATSTAAVAAAAKPVEKNDKATTKTAATAAKNLDAPLKVRRLVVAEDIERSKREPVGSKAAFKAADTDKIYAFVEVDNPTKSESEVFVTFEPQGDGASQGQVSLRVGAASRWRTWAYTRGAKKAGSWAAVVRSADGTVLAKTPFDVVL